MTSPTEKELTKAEDRALKWADNSGDYRSDNLYSGPMKVLALGYRRLRAENESLKVRQGKDLTTCPKCNAEIRITISADAVLYVEQMSRAEKAESSLAAREALIERLRDLFITSNGGRDQVDCGCVICEALLEIDRAKEAKP